MKWQVIETPCYPNKWKVNRGSALYGTNSADLFFKNREDAQAYCDRLNKKEDPDRLHS